MRGYHPSPGPGSSRRQRAVPHPVSLVHPDVKRREIVQRPCRHNPRPIVRPLRPTFAPAPNDILPNVNRGNAGPNAGQRHARGRWLGAPPGGRSSVESAADARKWPGDDPIRPSHSAPRCPGSHLAWSRPPGRGPTAAALRSPSRQPHGLGAKPCAGAALDDGHGILQRADCGKAAAAGHELGAGPNLGSHRA